MDYKSGVNYNYYLAVLSNDYVYDGYKESGNEVYRKDINNNELIRLVDVTNLTKEYQAIIFRDINKTIQYLDECKNEPVNFNQMCKLNSIEQCQYFFSCFPELKNKESLLNLVDKKSNILYKGKCSYQDLLANQIYKITDIDKDCYSLNNQIQYDCLMTNETHLLNDKILFGLAQFELPRAYLDFETFPSPLPLHEGENPYTQSVFQYSVHIETIEGILDKELNNFSFLSDGLWDCREELLASLLKVLKDYNVKSIIAYNASFEKNVLKKLGEIYKIYEPEIKGFIEHKLFDLKDIVENNQKFYEKIGYDEDLKINNYYKNDLLGSYSLKVVLPSIVGISYDDLDVKNGSQAYTLYSLFNKMNVGEFNKAYKSLIEYCKQDTYSLFLIVKELKRICLVT